MDLTPYIERLHHDLAVAADAGGEEARAVADRLTAPLESAAQLVLLEALTAAAEEITAELAPGSVEVRLRGGGPDFVVTPPPSAEGADATTSGDAVGPEPDVPHEGMTGRAAVSEEGGTARLNLRIPDTLKTRIEDAARAEGLSLNAWLVRAAAAALEGDRPGPHTRPRAPRGGQRFTGWVG